MSRKLFVGNLPYSVTSERLQEAFSQFGTVSSSKVIVDRETGRSRGFAFLEMETDDQGAAAMQAMNGALLDGRSIAVREAVGRVLRRWIRNPVEQLLAPRLRGRELVFEQLQLRLDPVQLLDLLRRRLPLGLPLRAQLLDRLLLGGKFAVAAEGSLSFLSRDNPFTSDRARSELGWSPTVRPEVGVPDAFRFIVS